MFVVYLSIVLILFGIWLKTSLSHWTRKGIPGPRPWPLIGNLGSLLMGKKTMGEVFVDIYKKYERYPFVGVYRATTPVLLVRDPELVHVILVKDFNSFRHNEFHKEKDTDPLVDRNPFVLRDKEWKEIRQMLTPGMTSGKMKNMFPLLERISKAFVKFIENHPTASTDGIETRALTKRLTLDNVAKTAFGIDGKCFESYDDISEFNKLANKFLTPGTIASLMLLIINIFPGLSNYLTFKLVANDVETKLTEIVHDVVQYRKDNNIKGNDYLQFLIDTIKERNLPEKEITSHACTFFIDGYETSSMVMTFLLFNLARYPKYQEKIREDIKKYEKDNNGALTYEAVHEMRWLNACFYESIRHTPPVEILTKLCSEPFEYTSSNPDFNSLSIKLAPGDAVILPYGMFGHDPKYFDNPEQFLPERMFERDSFVKGTFLPFGDGPRACIGQRLGIMQIKLGTAYVIKHFELSISEKLLLPIKYLSYHPFNEIQGGCWIRYKKLDS